MIDTYVALCNYFKDSVYDCKFDSTNNIIEIYESVKNNDLFVYRDIDTNEVKDCERPLHFNIDKDFVLSHNIGKVYKQIKCDNVEDIYKNMLNEISMFSLDLKQLNNDTYIFMNYNNKSIVCVKINGVYCVVSINEPNISIQYAYNCMHKSKTLREFLDFDKTVYDTIINDIKQKFNYDSIIIGNTVFIYNTNNDLICTFYYTQNNFVFNTFTQNSKTYIDCNDIDTIFDYIDYCTCILLLYNNKNKLNNINISYQIRNFDSLIDTIVIKNNITNSINRYLIHKNYIKYNDNTLNSKKLQTIINFLFNNEYNVIEFSDLILIQMLNIVDFTYINYINGIKIHKNRNNNNLIELIKTIIKEIYDNGYLINGETINNTINNNNDNNLLDSLFVKVCEYTYLDNKSKSIHITNDNDKNKIKFTYNYNNGNKTIYN